MESQILTPWGIGYTIRMDIYKEIPGTSWSIVTFEARIDSFNGHRYKKLLYDVVESGCLKIAIDLKDTQFISLPTIKFMASTARVLTMKGGHLALVGASDKLERQIGIFCNTNDFKFCESFNGLDQV